MDELKRSGHRTGLVLLLLAVILAQWRGVPGLSVDGVVVAVSGDAVPQAWLWVESPTVGAALAAVGVHRTDLRPLVDGDQVVVGVGGVRVHAGGLRFDDEGNP